jgi:uncharacterized membrane protein
MYSEDKTQAVLAQKVEYKGLIPSPEMMEGFKSVDSSFPERILAMAEKNSEARNKIAIQESNVKEKLVDNQKFAIEVDAKFKTRGQIFTLMIALFFIALSAFFGYIGKETAAIISIIGGLGAIIPSIIKGLTGK